MKGKAKSKKRAARPSATVREHILAAAVEIFSERGFADTSTRDIAQRAAVAEYLIYKHFKSKNGLFRAAVFAPISRVFESQTQNLRAVKQGIISPAAIPRSYTEGVFTAMREERRLLLDLIFIELSSKASDEGDASTISFRDYLRDFESAVRDTPIVQHLDISDLTTELRLVFAMILGVAVFEEIMFDEKDRDPERQMASIAKLLSRGAGVYPLMEGDSAAEVTPLKIEADAVSAPRKVRKRV